jgi:hypothetical protein
MKQNRPELVSSAWVSRFWAQYNKLPEPFKKGFFVLAQSMAKMAEKQYKGDVFKCAVDARIPKNSSRIQAL